MKTQMIFLFFSILITGLFAQVKNLERNLYQDPNGFFSVLKPDGWKTIDYKETSRGKVKFVHPANDKINLIITGSPNPFKSFNDLVQSSKNSDNRMKEKYQAYDVTVSSKLFTVENIEYVSSTYTLKKLDRKLFTVDLIMSNTHFVFSYASSISSFDPHLEKIYECLFSILPTNRKFTDKEITNALVESKIRQAQFNIQAGLNDYALKYIQEGLKLDPNNSKLLELQNQLKH